MEQPFLGNNNKTKSENQASNNELKYIPSEVQGECLLKQVIPVLKNDFKCMLFNVLSVLFAGIPILICSWYPKIKFHLFFQKSNIQECSHFYIKNYHNSVSIVDKTQEMFSQTTEMQWLVISFTNRYMKYIIMNNQIKAAIFDYKKRLSQIFKQQKTYLNKCQIEKLTNSYGPGTMILQQPSFLELLIGQILRPLYIFIVFSLLFWIWTQYYQYSLIIFVTTSFGLIVNLFQLKSLNKKIYDMAYSEMNLTVFRQNKIQTISSINIVPGDIVFVKNSIKLSFQGIILQGSALINQCALTGQSVPVLKKASESAKYQVQNIKVDKNSFVYEGTTIIQVNQKNKMKIFESQRQFGIPICVIRTNFSTMKGQLIRIILFPKITKNPFQSESNKFLIFLFFVAIVSYCILVIKLHTVVSTYNLVIKIIDLITITVPPGLPVSMTFGIIFALDKLKNKQIYCTSPNKVISGGRIDFACFDKTGTLTQDFMDLHGILPCNNRKFELLIEADLHQNKKQKNNILNKKQFQSILLNMASNHTLVQIQKSKQLIGDPMQIKLFQFGNNQFDYSGNDSDVIFSFKNKNKIQGKVYKRFQFDSNLLRMSVLCITSFSNNYDYEKNQDNIDFQKSKNQEKFQQFQVFCKGSPEKMIQIMVQESVPQNYLQKLKQYASHGFRVLAIGSKKIQKNSKDIPFIGREQLQTKLNFDGFQIFQNKLKKQSFDAIKQLKDASINSVMITGDNALTACNISFKCQISDIHKKIIICDYKQNNFTEQDFFFNQSTQKSRRSYKQKNRNSNFDNEYHAQKKKQKYKSSILMKQMKIHSTISESSVQKFVYKLLQRIRIQKAQICLTGNAFQKLWQYIQSNYVTKAYIIQDFVKSITVFARAKPNNKVKVVMLYQKIRKTVIMCGDGANDCGALKQADVGLSLSQCEASISAPFTSKIINISSVPELIKQCRAGLATNFSLFNIMAMYSLIQYSSSIITQFFYAYPSRSQYLYWDLAGNFFFFLTFGYTGTIQTLNKFIPKNSLFSSSNILQLLFMFIVQLFGQILMILIISGNFAHYINYYSNGGQQIDRQRYFQEGNFVSDTPETDIIFLFSNFMYIFSLLAFSISKPWRKQFYTNIPFMIILVIVFTYSFLLCVVPFFRFQIFGINWMTSEILNLFVLVSAITIGCFMYLFQKHVFQPCGFRNLYSNESIVKDENSVQINFDTNSQRQSIGKHQY